MESFLFTFTQKNPSEFLVKQRAKSNEQRAKSNEQRAKTNQVYYCEMYHLFYVHF